MRIQLREQASERERERGESKSITSKDTGKCRGEGEDPGLVVVTGTVVEVTGTILGEWHCMSSEKSWNE